MSRFSLYQESITLESLLTVLIRFLTALSLSAPNAEETIARKSQLINQNP